MWCDKIRFPVNVNTLIVTIILVVNKNRKTLRCDDIGRIAVLGGCQLYPREGVNK